MIILWFTFGIALPIILLFFTKLILEVRDDGLYIRYMPFHFRYKQFLFKDIKHYESIIYSPLKRFGGWGIRINLNGETAYNMNGKQGLELKLRNQTVVIGTQNPNEIKKAMDSLNKTQNFIGDTKF